MSAPSSRTFAAICSVETRISATSSACVGRAITVMSAQLSQVACRSRERTCYARRTRKNAITPSATTASAAAPRSNGPGPEPGFGTGVTCTATALGEGDAVGFSAAATVGDGVALGAGEVGAAVGDSVAVVGGAVGATLGGLVWIGVGTGVGTGVGAGVVTSWTTIEPFMNV